MVGFVPRRQARPLISADIRRQSVTAYSRSGFLHPRTSYIKIDSTQSAQLRRSGALFDQAPTLKAVGMSTGILPQSGLQQFDNATAAFLNGGLLHIYNPGTTTPAAIFSDFALTAALPDPIVLNAAGRIPAVYSGSASVRMRLLNSAGVLQTDIDNIAMGVAASGGGGGSAIVPQQTFLTGDIKIAYSDQPMDGYVRANGRTIGSATSGATERANSDTQSLFLALWGFANISVVTGKGASAAADWSANKQLILPDMAGRLIGALDDLGNGAAGRITGTTVTAPTVIGASGGAQAVTIAQANLPVVDLATAIAVGQGAHTHTVTGDSSSSLVRWKSAAGGTFNNVTTGAGNSVDYTSSGATATSATLPAMTGTTPLGGSGTATNNMPPVMLFTVYLKL